MVLPPPAAPSGPPPLVVVSNALRGGVAEPAPPSGVIIIPLTDSPNRADHAELHLDMNSFSSLPGSIQLRVVNAVTIDSRGAGTVQQGQLGGGVARPLAPPFDVQLLAVDRLSGQVVGLPPSVAGATIEVRLPLPVAVLEPGEEVAWLMEVDDSNGQFLGYLRPPARFDAATSQLVLSVLANQLQGTLFLPVVLTDAYVRNFSTRCPHLE